MGGSTPYMSSRPWGDDDVDGDTDEYTDEYKSEVSSASEYDADLFDSEEPASPSPSPLDALAQSLADEALGRFFSTSSCHSSSSFHHHHSPTIPPTPPPRTYTCPYYIRDPTTHVPCRPRAASGAASGGLFFPRLLDLRRHLQTAHRRPPWCPACGARFARAAARDVHVRAFACVPPSSASSSSEPVQLPAPPAGLADTQLRRLARRPDPAASAERQWAALWRLCFGDDEEVPSLGW